MNELLCPECGHPKSLHSLNHPWCLYHAEKENKCICHKSQYDIEMYYIKSENDNLHKQLYVAVEALKHISGNPNNSIYLCLHEEMADIALAEIDKIKEGV